MRTEKSGKQRWHWVYLELINEPDSVKPGGLAFDWFPGVLVWIHFYSLWQVTLYLLSEGQGLMTKFPGASQTPSPYCWVHPLRLTLDLF